MAAGLKTIIALSFVRSTVDSNLRHFELIPDLQVLAIGFLLVILSAALFHNFLTLLVVATYILAPLPNWICQRCANPDDFMESAGNAVIDFGRFCTGFLVVMGIGKVLRRRYTIRILTRHTALPVSYWRIAHLIQIPAMAMSIVGGLLIYGTIISFTQFFKEEQDF